MTARAEGLKRPILRPAKLVLKAINTTNDAKEKENGAKNGEMTTQLNKLPKLVLTGCQETDKVEPNKSRPWGLWLGNGLRALGQGDIIEWEGYSSSSEMRSVTHENFIHYFILHVICKYLYFIV